MKTFQTDKPGWRIGLLVLGAIIGFATGIIASALLGAVLIK